MSSEQKTDQTTPAVDDKNAEPPAAPSNTTTASTSGTLVEKNASPSSNPWTDVSSRVKQGAKPANARAVPPSKAGEKKRANSNSNSSNNSNSNSNANQDKKGKRSDNKDGRKNKGRNKRNATNNRTNPNFSYDTFVSDLYNFAQDNSNARGFPIYWYDTKTHLWLAGRSFNSLGLRQGDRIPPVFFGQYPYPVFYGTQSSYDFRGYALEHMTAPIMPNRGPPRIRHAITPKERANFNVKIENGKLTDDDPRTSLMIRNIPNKYTQEMLLEEFHAYRKQFDLFYLPIDQFNHCNVGYAFINFLSPAHIPAFYQHFQGLHWTQFQSSKVCELTYARIQGKDAMLDHFRTSTFLVDHATLGPMVFDPESGEVQGGSKWPSDAKKRKEQRRPKSARKEKATKGKDTTASTTTSQK